MTTELILTGSGVPDPDPERGTAGMMVRHDDLYLQFDAGRAAVMRMGAVTRDFTRVAALFLTHRHSDHLHSVGDLAQVRWFQSRGFGRGGPLPMYMPAGGTAAIVRTLIDIWAEEFEMANPSETVAAISEFDPPDEPREVWSQDGVRVLALGVPHGVPAVAYRIETPDGAIVYSGDTTISDRIERLSAGASVLVHEVLRYSIMKGTPLGDDMAKFHADAEGLGALAQRAGVPALILMHYVPAPQTQRHLDGFEKDVRAGGYTGDLILGHDLLRHAVGG